jgi:peptidoglycan hydrolase CwlO-like protein
MKKLTAISILAILFLAITSPISWAVEDDAPGTGMSGTPRELADLQKTLESDRLDRIEQSISALTEKVSSISDRVQDLERTVDDDNYPQ